MTLIALLRVLRGSWHDLARFVIIHFAIRGGLHRVDADIA
jgi:hypothetical protein